MSLPLILDSVPTRSMQIETPMGEYVFEFVIEEDFVFVPILRAGLPMLNGALRVFQKASVGFLAIRRDEETLKSHVYYSRLPHLEGKHVVILDPMLATGGTLELALKIIMEKNPKKVYTFHLVASPEGVERFKYWEVSISTVSLDDGLNTKGYIVPGVGDMGDRLFSDCPPSTPLG